MQEQYLAVDVTGDRNKVRCCKEQYSIRTWNVRCMNQGKISSVQFSSVAQSCPTICDPMNRSTPGLPVHHQLLEFTQTHVHRVSDAISPADSQNVHVLSCHLLFDHFQFTLICGLHIPCSETASVRVVPRHALEASGPNGSGNFW